MPKRASYCVPNEVSSRTEPSSNFRSYRRKRHDNGRDKQDSKLMAEQSRAVIELIRLAKVK